MSMHKRPADCEDRGSVLAVESVSGVSSLGAVEQLVGSQLVESVGRHYMRAGQGLKGHLPCTCGDIQWYLRMALSYTAPINASGAYQCSYESQDSPLTEKALECCLHIF